ncbi:MAG: DNA polymerase/3'-5' exonuclease PolX [Phycisphaerales bacterium]
MGFNQDIASILDEMGDLLQLLGADSFRASAHAKAARIIKDHPTDLSTLVEDKKALTAIEGIGAKTADKIVEYAAEGAVYEHGELLTQVPRGLLDVLKIPGLGPKTVRLLWQDKGIESLDDLKAAIEKGELEGVPRMGKKTIENMKEAIEFMEASAGRTPIGRAMPVAEAIVERMKAVTGVKKAEFAGSLRRGEETIGDIDVLVTTNDPDAALEAFVSMEDVTKVLARGDTKASVRLSTRGLPIQADLRVVPDASFGAALMYFTGSKDYNVRLREIALSKGMTLNEYGLFPEDDEDTPPQSRGVKPKASKTEASIFKALGVPERPPELRAGTGVEEAPPDGLLMLADIVSELHAHTTASDGKLSMRELAECAKARGFHTIAVTDHSRAATIANGLSPERLREQIKQVRELNEEIEGITVLAGSEVDILPDGTLDFDDDLLAELDIVVASPHLALKQSASDATDRLLKAIEHPLVHIIGHPCGRLVQSREGLTPNIHALAEAAAANETALEINANWHRLDLRDTHVRVAMEAGALIAIDCDVHREQGFDNLRYGVLTGRRGGLTKDRCVNAWSRAELTAWLGSKR